MQNWNFHCKTNNSDGCMVIGKTMVVTTERWIDKMENVCYKEIVFVKLMGIFIFESNWKIPVPYH